VGFSDGRVKTAAEEIVDLVSDLRHAMQAAPLPDKVAASLVSFDDFQAVFFEFLAAQKAAQNASRCAGALSDTLQVGMQAPVSL
jgi:hypothetical protein